MRRLLMSTVVASVFAIAAHARANTIFTDTFNSENGGNPTLNYYGFSNWTVSQGSVDLIGNGYFDFIPGNGLYVDLDGSTGQAGTMVSNPLALGAGSYLFQFDMAGSHRGPIEPVTASVSLGNVVLDSQLFNLPSDQGFTTFTLPFALGGAGNVTLSFAEVGNSNMGLLLDNVSISTASVGTGAPLPSAAWGGLVLMTGILAAKVRKQRIACLA